MKVVGIVFILIASTISWNICIGDTITQTPNTPSSAATSTQSTPDASKATSKDTTSSTSPKQIAKAPATTSSDDNNSPAKYNSIADLPKAGTKTSSPQNKPKILVKKAPQIKQAISKTDATSLDKCRTLTDPAQLHDCIEKVVHDTTSANKTAAQQQHA